MIPPILVTIDLTWINRSDVPLPLNDLSGAAIERITHYTHPLMELYTFILEYRGGTYISQFQARSEKEALETWFEKQDFSVIWKLKEKHRDKIREWCAEFGPVAIDTTSNVWCATFHIKGHMGLLNFVLTKSA